MMRSKGLLRSPARKAQLCAFVVSLLLLFYALIYCSGSDSLGKVKEVSKNPDIFASLRGSDSLGKVKDISKKAENFDSLLLEAEIEEIRQSLTPTNLEANYKAELALSLENAKMWAKKGDDKMMEYFLQIAEIKSDKLNVLKAENVNTLKAKKVNALKAAGELNHQNSTQTE